MNDSSNDRTVVGAIQSDMLARHYRDTYGPTPQEQREAERREVARAFEHGDHQPDGTVLPPGEYPYRLPEDGMPVPAPAEGWTETRKPLKPNNVYDAAGMCGGMGVGLTVQQGMDKVREENARLHGIERWRLYHSEQWQQREIRGGELCVDLAKKSPGIVQSAVQAMTAAQALEQASRTRCERQGFLTSGAAASLVRDEEMVTIAVSLVMDRAEAVELRARLTEHPDCLQKVLDQMQREACYELREVFGVLAKPLA
ncbi:hypothetical protein GCM10028796_46890 [Ramlibacter monticola]|uniref:Uncharacterized protein n=1 Tax=Ramlibacter monticola TaxID=1926872 RepID=A0A936Z3M6_9BURK|nr:hypothetical protein [Ramlibacter monticola]MBL0394314.1 hypothetical protein [Ramlibacter monticola]